MKLNLGCGAKIKNGYVNVDKFDYYDVDKVHDLEKFPYPFDDDVVDEILMSHVLEHIGQDPDIFNNIIKELYRICKNNALINIHVPHPRHDDFITDPTHVRPVTVAMLELYSKANNELWAIMRAANSPLGLIHNVNFEVVSSNLVVDERIRKKIETGEIKRDELQFYIDHHNNIVKQIDIKWRVIK
jgi:SAM-dependent methyltransferase|tara:strand:- start:219 stop:776 length:558 start_codon:yes stop_codon:yes gene_type:complete